MYDIKIIQPKNGSTVTLDSDAVADYFDNYIPEYGLKYFDKGENLPMKSVKLEWSANNGENYEVYVADNPNFSCAEKYAAGSSSSLELENLIPNKRYFWKVKVTDASGNRNFSEVYDFKTKGHVRALKLDGVSNARDLGGAVTKDGRRIKYGVIFRSANGDSITDNGKAAIKRLCVKTDLDLRGAGAEKSPFGDDVKLITINGAYYFGNDTGIQGSKEYRNAFRDELKACANPDNYPMLFHCAIGRDRTGTLSFILQALCGVEKDDLIREYELSYLAVGGAADKNMGMVKVITEFYNCIDALSGNTFTDKTVALVKSLGVTDDEIDSIKRIMLD